MKLHYALERDSDTPLVVAIGFFDGMHLGHQDIARKTLRLRKPGLACGGAHVLKPPRIIFAPGVRNQR